jgi:phosphoribosylformylglycinamidine cyclo-ligase
MAAMSGLSYENSGVNYDVLDAFKRACQHAAGPTRAALERHGLTEPAGVRGESAYLIEAEDEYLAHVEEGLGTKNLVADAMLALTGRSFYRAIGIDTVATIANDLITCGALPVSIAMHAGVGDARWFADEQRARDLAEGFADGCVQAQAVWGGGETPALRGIIEPGAIVLAGSALGRIRPKSRRIVGDVRAGDAMVFLASSGVQTNGLTLCRRIAEALPQGYLTKLSAPGPSRSYGEALLDPSVIYVRFVQACQDAGLPLHYLAHVTGHGWRKLMRLEEPFVYRVTAPRPPLPIFQFLMQAGPIDLREAYATFNMGVGFAAYVSPGDAERCVAAARGAGYDAWVAGVIAKDGSRKAVEVPALGLTFEGQSLRLR